MVVVEVVIHSSFVQIGCQSDRGLDVNDYQRNWFFDSQASFKFTLNLEVLIRKLHQEIN